MAYFDMRFWRQVHRGTLHDGRQVAMKIQYPGVARSIESDVDNLLRLISYANVLPKGLYVEAAAKVSLCTACLRSQSYLFLLMQGCLALSSFGGADSLGQCQMSVPTRTCKPPHANTQGLPCIDQAPHKRRTFWAC